jgi:hypothetical protein
VARAEKLDHRGPETAAHKLINPWQSMLVFEVPGFFGPIFGSCGTHDFNRNGIFVRIQRKTLAQHFHKGAFLAKFPRSPGGTSGYPSEPARAARHKWTCLRNGAAFHRMRPILHPCCAMARVLALRIEQFVLAQRVQRRAIRFTFLKCHFESR